MLLLRSLTSRWMKNKQNSPDSHDGIGVQKENCRSISENTEMIKNTRKKENEKNY